MQPKPNRTVTVAAKSRILAAVLLGVALPALAAAACSDDADSSEESLGVVRVADGEAIRIRTLLAGPGERSGAYSNSRIVRLAVEHFGPIHGFDVHVGEGHDDYCAPDGGRGAAETILADRSVVGVIGTACSVAAVEAAPLLSGAGMVLISPTNTSPALTSDLAGNRAEHNVAGYYRTAHNDLFQGRAVALFLREDRGLGAVAVIHTGDVYTGGLAEAFIDAFEELGGEVTGSLVVNREATDLVPALTALASGSPQALFLPVSQTVGEAIVQQAPGVAGMDDVLLIAGDGLIDDEFMAQPETEGLFFSGPQVHFGNNRNESTGLTAAEVRAAYEEFYGTPPDSAFWGHAYDATTLLLEAIEAAADEQDGTLVVDRAKVRAHLDGVDGYAGLIGGISCDPFGDCGRAVVEILEHLDAGDVGAGRSNSVYEYAP